MRSSLLWLGKQEFRQRMCVLVYCLQLTAAEIGNRDATYEFV